MNVRADSRSVQLYARCPNQIFPLLNRHLNQTSGEREFILIPFWNLDVHLLPGTCANICLFGIYLFLYCIVCIWHTKTVLLLLRTSQANVIVTMQVEF